MHDRKQLNLHHSERRVKTLVILKTQTFMELVIVLHAFKYTLGKVIYMLVEYTDIPYRECIQHVC